MASADHVLTPGNKDNIMAQSNRWLSILNLWYERSRQRRQLRELAADADILKDIGVSNYDAIREGRKPFWRD